MNEVGDLIKRYVYIKGQKNKSKLLESAMKRMSDEYKEITGFDIEESKAFKELWKNKL